MARLKKYFFSRESVKNLLIMTVVIIAFTIASHFLFDFSSETVSNETGHIDIAALFMLAIMLIARWTTGYFWGILASCIGVVVINTLYIYPYSQMNFFIEGYPVVFICLVTMAIVTSALSGKIKKQLNESRTGEETAQLIAQFGQQLIATSGYDETVHLIIEHLYNQSGRPVVFLRNAEAIEQRSALVFAPSEGIKPNEDEIRAARDCFGSKSETGFGMLDYPDAALRFFPLISHGELMGVVGIEWEGMEDLVSLRFRFCLDWAALALERQKLEDNAKQIAMEADREILRNNLLRSISHDLRTPLTGIIGATAAILENRERIDHDNMIKLMKDVNDDAVWLLRMTENLLSVSRLTSDDMTITKQYEAVEEIVADAVSRCKKRHKETVVAVEVPEEPLFVPMDGTLIGQVLINLIENGVRHGHSSVSIKVQENGDNAEFIVRDYGPGLSEEVLGKLFHSVEYKKPETGRGLGIGLSLCQTIIQAHGGTITGRNHEDGGAEFRFALPLEEETDEVE